MNAVIVTEYLDYRQYLTDFYQFKKALNKSYSFRMFSNKAGLSSPSYLKMVINKERSLSYKTIKKFSKGLDHNEVEEKYFEILVMFNQASTNEARSNYFKQLLAMKKKNMRASSLDHDSFDFLSNWYTVAIYVLIGTPQFQNDLNWIHKKLKEKVSVNEIKKSLELMLNLNLIKADEVHGYIQSNGTISASDDTKKIAVYNYHSQMLKLADDSLRNDASDLREFNGATVSISLSDLPLIKEKIRQFRKEINHLCSNELDGNQIFQLNVNFFALSELEKC
jgi:uncharacterized protein (TIGR02147 family)